jgi:hypothetical protein
MKQNKHWVTVLDEQCKKTSQARVSARLRQPDGFPSPTIINQVIHNKYPGRIDRLQALVEGVYMQHTVQCPVLDEISADQCESHQSRPFAATNPTRVKLYQACRNNCKHSRLESNNE